MLPLDCHSWDGRDRNWRPSTQSSNQCQEPASKCLPVSSLLGNNDRLRIMFCSSRALLRSACPIRVWNGIFAAGDRRAKKALEATSPSRDQGRRPRPARIGRKNGLSASELSVAGIGRLGGGDSRYRTGCPPRSHRQSPTESGTGTFRAETAPKCLICADDFFASSARCRFMTRLYRFNIARRLREVAISCQKSFRAALHCPVNLAEYAAK
jgi:hypothetical protein